MCRERSVAIQTIKSIARRRWRDEDGPRYSWYEPLRDPQALRRAVNYVFGRDGLFLNTSSDATLLEETLAAAGADQERPSDATLREDATRHQMEPLFVRGLTDTI